MKVKRMTEVETNRPKIGDRISFTLKTGEAVEAMAVRKLVNGMVFCAVDYLDEPYPMNHNGGTRGGYEASGLRKKLNSAILECFPDDLRKQLIPFDNGDYITIPSEREMFGKNIYAKDDEGDVMQWGPMADRNNRIALLDGDIGWGWLRNVASSTAFAICSPSGRANDWITSEPNGVRPVFLIAEEGKAKIHQLKILDCFADEIIAGNKMFELRKNDRDYQKGDYICFTVISDESEREIKHAINTRLYEITCVLSGWGLMDGYVALGIREAGWGRKRNAIDRED